MLSILHQSRLSLARRAAVRFTNIRALAGMPSKLRERLMKDFSQFMGKNLFVVFLYKLSFKMCVDILPMCHIKCHVSRFCLIHAEP